MLPTKHSAFFFGIALTAALAATAEGSDSPASGGNDNVINNVSPTIDQQKPSRDTTAAKAAASSLDTEPSAPSAPEAVQGSESLESAVQQRNASEASDEGESVSSSKE